MSNQGKNRKGLKFGILAAVVVLTMVLCLAGCNNEQAEGETTAPTTSVGGETEQLDLYWNMDRALYDGKSEAGMSSREPGEDGYFHVRFFKDGEIVELRVADRKTVNALEVQDLMGLEFDEDGVVIGIIPVDDLPIEKLAWQFYVQSAGGKLIKANSSATLNGMEVLLETNENTGVWDMTGLSGDVGCEADPMQLDRIMALGDADGNVLHVFIYERPNYMKTHEGECEHCQKTVTWYEWTKEGSLPVNTGHYQLMVDLTGVRQASMVEDAKICLDLNGHRIDGASGARIYSLHNAGTELAVMDTSEAKTGRIAAHGKGDQGMCVWLRYGVFYLYDGILDGSDATTHLNGPTVNMASNTYFYMYGGELIGGTADVVSNGKGGWTGGVAGTLFIGANSKFVMNDGIIHGGYAKAAITKYDASGKPTAYSCGSGGNIFANTGAVIELNGGTIRDGRAAIYGNIYLGGKVEMTMNAGLIAGGSLYFPSSNGGNIGVHGTANFIMNGGTIRNGRVYNCGGNVYVNGRFQMNDGIITDGKILNWTTKKVNDAAASRNVFSVNGDFYMYGGRVAGGFQAIDTDAKSNPTIVLVSARSVIFDEDGTGPHLTLSNTTGGGICDLYVGQMHDEGKVGISAVQTAVFSKPTNVNNTDNFISDIEGADIGWTENGLAIGKIHCLCSQDPEIGDDEHKLGCDKIQYAWAPWTSATSLPTSEGYWYLTKNVTTTGNAVRTYGDDHLHVALDLNGKTVQANSGRMYSLFENSSTFLEDGKTIAPNIEGEAIELTLTDTLGGGTVNMGSRTDADQGQLIWGRWNDSVINILAGTYNCSAVNSKRWNGVVIDAAGELNIYGGTLSGGNGTGTGGMISAKNFNLYGGVIENGTATWGGGNVQVKGGGVMNMYGGTIRGGSVNVKALNTGDSGYGGNIYVNGTFNMYDGVIEGGESRCGRKDGTATGENAGGGLAGNLHVGGEAYLYGGTIQNGKSDTGGNIGTNNGGSYIYLDGVQVLNGEAINGGNIAINVRANKLLEIKGDTYIAGGKATSNGGNLYCSIWLDAPESNIQILGGIIEDGYATQKGGNVYLSGAKTKMYLSDGQILNGDTTDCGGNIHLAGGTRLVMTGGLVKGGTKNGAGTSISNVYSVNGAVELTGGEIAGDFGNTNTFANGCSIKVGGTAKVTKGLGGNGLSLGVHPGDAAFARPSIEVMDGFSGNILMSASGYVSTPCDAKYVANFSTLIPDTGIHHQDGKIYVGKVMCVCGGKAVGVGDHKCQNVVWTPWTSKTSMPKTTGNYYLVFDVTANGTSFGNEGTINIDLNGHTYTGSGDTRMFRVRDDANKYADNYKVTIGLTDSVGGGFVKLTHTGRVQDGALVWMTEKTHTFNLYAGVLDASSLTTADNKDSSALKLGAGVFNMYGGEIKGGNSPVWDGGTAFISSGTTFNLYGGKVSGGQTGGHGGNFLVAGTLNVKGGTITEGYASGAGHKGGNIYIRSGGVVNVSGGTISNGHADDCGGNIHVVGGGKLFVSGGTITGGYKVVSGGKDYNSISNVYSVNGYIDISGGKIDGGIASCNTSANACTLKISGNPVIGTDANGNGLSMSVYPSDAAFARPMIELGKLTSGASIAINSTGVVTSNTVTADQAAYFHPVAEGNTATVVDNAANYGVAAGDVGKLYIGHVHCICGGSIPSGTKLADGTTHTCQNVAFTAITSLSAVGENRNVYLSKDITLGGQVTMKGAYTLNLCLNGHNVIGKNATRMFRSITNGTAEQPTADSTYNITTCDPNYTDGQTDKNCIKASGNTDQDGGIFLMGKGKVQLIRGTLDASQYTTMANSAGSGKHGGAVALTGGSFVQYPGTTIIGGWAKRNNASESASHGGAVYIGNGSSVYTMLGGTIKDGFCHQLGGNVYVYSGTFNMYDGVIKNGALKNTDTAAVNMYGLDGNVTLRGGAKFNMMGGTIYGKVNGFLEACNGMTISGSAKIVWDDTANGIVGNNLGPNKITANLGKLNADAKIGFCISWDPKGTDVKLANITDPASFDLSKVGLHVTFTGKGDRTFGMKVVDNVLYAYETTPVAP